MVFEESRMRFEFPDDSRVVKFDNEKFYRTSFNALPGSRGVDFISANEEALAFIEVKNCVGDEGNNRWRIFPDNRKRETSSTNVNVEGRNSLDIEVAEKVAMTLAARWLTHETLDSVDWLPADRQLVRKIRMMDRIVEVRSTENRWKAHLSGSSSDAYVKEIIKQEDANGSEERTCDDTHRY